MANSTVGNCLTNGLDSAADLLVLIRQDSSEKKAQWFKKLLWKTTAETAVDQVDAGRGK